MHFAKVFALAVFFTHATSLPILQTREPSLTPTPKNASDLISRTPLLTPAGAKGSQDDNTNFKPRSPLLKPAGAKGSQDDDTSFKPRSPLLTPSGEKGAQDDQAVHS